MSIASELAALNGYILGAYDEINTKGGTVPANKNMANLASAIATISGGGGGGTVLGNMGTFTPSTAGVYNLEHGLDKKPIIWGIKSKASLQNMKFERYEAIQKLNYYMGSAVNQIDIYAYQAVTVGTGVNSNARLYNQLLNVAAVWKDATTEWTSAGATSMPVNDKYIGVNVYAAGSTLNSHLKVGVEYLWFAIASSDEA